MVNIIWTERLQHAFEDYVQLTKDAEHAFHDPAILTQAEDALRSCVVTAPPPKGQGLVEAQETASTSPPPPPPTSVDLELVRKISASLLACEKKTKGSHDDASLSTEPSKYWIHTLLKGSGVYVPPPPGKQKSPELERILAQARAQIAEKEYDRMMQGITKSSSGSGSLRDQVAELREFKSTLIAIANVLYTGAAVFLAVYMLSKHIFDDVGMRFLLGFLGFILIVASESYLYYRHVTAGDASESHRSKRRTSASVSSEEVAHASPPYDIMKNALHDDVMKAAIPRTTSVAADEKSVPLEPLANTTTTTTTSAKTSTTTATKRRSKKA